MKNLRLITAALAAVFLVGCRTAAPVEDYTDASAMVASHPFDYSLVETAQHPRLLADDADFEILMEAVAKGDNALLTRFHNLSIAIADEYCAEPLEVSYTFDESNFRLLQHATRAVREVFAWCYAYRATHDAKYLARVEEVVATICGFPSWNQEKHYLDVAEFTMAMAIAYDWLYDALPAETKTLIEKNIHDNAFTTWQGMWWREKTHNWNQVCYGGLCYAAIALYDVYPQECRDIIEDAVEHNVGAQVVSYSPDGNYPEGIGYWGYGTLFETMMLAAFDKTFGHSHGLDLIKGFDRTGEFVLNMVGSSNQTFNFYDNAAKVACYPPMWWFAARFSNPSLLLSEVQKVENGMYDSCRDRFVPYIPILISQHNIDLSKIKSPDYKVYHGEGDTPIVIVHGDWSMGESDVYLAVKGGMAMTNHGHMDAGSFVFDSYGMRWAEDLGNIKYAEIEAKLAKVGGDYWDKENQNSYRWKVLTMRNEMHNTLTVNGAQHVVDGFATVEKVIDAKHEQGAVLDMTGPLAWGVASAQRTVKVVDGRTLVVADEIAAPADREAQVEWRMCTGAAVTLEEGGALLSQGGRQMRLSASADVAIKAASWPCAAEYEWDPSYPDKTMVGYTFTVPAGQKATVTVNLAPVE